MQGKSVTDIDWDAEIGKSGVESAAHIRRRAYQFLEEQCKANQDKLVLVVTHGSFIRYLFSMIDSKFDLKCPVKKWFNQFGRISKAFRLSKCRI